MKRLIPLLVSFFLLISNGEAQSLDRFFKKYSKDERIEFTSVGGLMMKFTSIFTGISPEAKEVIPKLTGIKILSLNGDSTVSDLSNSFSKDLDKMIQKGKFDTTFESRIRSNKVNIYKRVTKKDKADVVIVSKKGKESRIIWLKGKMTKEEMDKIFKENSEEETDSIE